ncbi:hypothetical protein V1514DRAFT_335675 [Lipomyces japonicus]|uniref:uncharacterized protein n=1 Tax=Lipomyces japonicus TaxID=56871 RepID=UPI0034CF6C2E
MPAAANSRLICIATAVASLAVSAAAYLLFYSPAVIRNDDDVDDEQRQRYTVGLHNPSNDCFANSVLQALSSSSVLESYLATDRVRQYKLSSALLIMISDLNTPIRYARASSPWPFLHVLESIFKSRISRTQHDAHELMHLILQTLTDEYAATTTTTAGAPPFEGSTLDSITCQQCFRTTTTSRCKFVVLTLPVPQQSSTTVQDLLAKLLAPEYVTGYGCQSCRLAALAGTARRVVQARNLQADDDDDDDVGVDVVPKLAGDPVGYYKYVCKLANSAASMTADLPAEIEHDLPRTVRSTIVRQTSLHDLPGLLIVQLSRSIFDGHASSRNDCAVQVSEFITLYSSAGVSSLLYSAATTTTTTAGDDDGLANKKTYRLVGMIRHSGTHSAGHYECYKRKPPQASTATERLAGGPQQPRQRQWWRISDEKVWQVSTSEVLKQTGTAYMLVYETVPIAQQQRRRRKTTKQRQQDLNKI